MAQRVAFNNLAAQFLTNLAYWEPRIMVSLMQAQTVQQLQTEIDRYKPGDSIKITVLRDNKKTDLAVTLQEARRQ